MKIIPVGTMECFVDDEDYDWVTAEGPWRLLKPYRSTAIYARAHDKADNNVAVLMHNLILGSKNVDHINENGLDNQRHNLRLATGTQNQANKSKYFTVRTTSQFKGVHWNSNRQKWVAGINVHKKHFYLGSFDIETEAALAYDRAALVHFGEFAKLNFK